MGNICLILAHTFMGYFNLKKGYLFVQWEKTCGETREGKNICNNLKMLKFHWAIVIIVELRHLLYIQPSLVPNLELYIKPRAAPGMIPKNRAKSKPGLPHGVDIK